MRMKAKKTHSIGAKTQNPSVDQLSLFKSKPCDVCGKQVYTKPPYHAIYDGVRDMGTGEFRCWPCNRKHYQKPVTLVS